MKIEGLTPAGESQAMGEEIPQGCGYQPDNNTA
jgi:hypothetical protein